MKHLFLLLALTMTGCVDYDAPRVYECYLDDALTLRLPGVQSVSMESKPDGTEVWSFNVPGGWMTYRAQPLEVCGPAIDKPG